MRTDSKQVREQVRLLRESVFEPFNAAMFAALGRSRAERVHWCKIELDKLFKWRAEDVSASADTFVADWWIARRQKQLEEAEREHKRFTFYAKLCKGQVKEDILQIEQAREVPIGEVMPEGPKGRSGGREKFTCPLHEGDRDPSFVWFMEKNRYKCFGCGAWGDVIDLVMKLHKVGFVEAVKQLTHS